MGAMVLLILGCKEQKPIPGTPEHLQAHGIVENAVNQIQVGQVVWQFPPQYRPMPYSDGAIVPGRATELVVDVPLPPGFGSPTVDANPHSNLIVHLYPTGIEDEKSKAESLTQWRWTSIAPRPEWGVMEYVDARDTPRRSYRVLDDSYKTPRGGTLIFHCNGPDRHGYQAECSCGYLHPNGALIRYYFPGYLMPRWREVHNEAVKIVNLFEVK